MKKNIVRSYLALFALALTVILLAFGISFSESASADGGNPAYSFYFNEWNVTYDIESNRDIKVCEDLTVTFTGTLSTGFIRDIPANGGELVRDIKVVECTNSGNLPVTYYVYSEFDDSSNATMCVDIGDSGNKRGQTHTYRLTYRYPLTKAQEGANRISLNLIGVGRDYGCDIKSAFVKVLLPDGYKTAEFFAGKLSDNYKIPFNKTQENGKTVLSISPLALGYNEGITANFDFNEGVLSTYFEFTPYIFVIIGAVLLIVALVVKVFASNKNPVIPVVNFEAPDKMDPLMMGKLIDNSVDNEDLTSMIFYWADKGYIKIDLTDENDPSLIRIVQSLPQGTPDYENVLFNGMFGRNDVVKPSALTYKFYKTADKATGIVNARSKGLYEKKSLTLAIVFAALSGLLLGLAPFIIGITGISLKYTEWISFAALIPAIVINGFCQTIKTRGFKSSNTTALLWFAVAGVCILYCFIYALIVPTYVMGYIPIIILALLSCAISIISAFIITRTKEYTERLNEITGFKEFIRVAEKDQLEKMIETNPQFYYHVLPYAQVLGVSDMWAEKFKNITMVPPNWCTNHYSLFDFYIFNRIMRTSFAGMSRSMYSRPSSSGSGGHGGFGGGHVGGGHGGGGARGR